jgi:hypothetical protein
MKKIVLAGTPENASDCPFSSDGDCTIFYTTVGSTTHECNGCLCYSKQGFDFCECPFCVSLEDMLNGNTHQPEASDFYINLF